MSNASTNTSERKVRDAADLGHGLEAEIERYWNMLGEVAINGKCGSEAHDVLRSLIVGAKRGPR